MSTFTKEDFITRFGTKAHVVVKFKVKVVPETFLRELVNIHNELFVLKRFRILSDLIYHWREDDKRKLPKWVFMTDDIVQFARNIAKARTKSIARHLIAQFMLGAKYVRVCAIKYDETTDKDLALVSTPERIQEFKRRFPHTMGLDYVYDIEFSELSR